MSDPTEQKTDLGLVPGSEQHPSSPMGPTGRREGQRLLQKREAGVEREGGPTLAVHAHGIKQAGATELGTEQRHIEPQEPSLAVVSRRQVQLAAAADSAGGGRTGLPSPTLRHRQEAVHEMQF